MKKFKPLADYKGQTFINSIIHKLDKVCSRIIVVTGFRSDELKAFIIENLEETKQYEIISRLNFVYNKVFQKGMFTILK